MDIYDPIGKALGLEPIELDFQIPSDFINVGGFQGRKHSEETKILIRTKKRFQKISEEQKLKISLSNTGRKRSDEAKQKMRMAKLGKKQTPEHIAAAAATRIGKKKAPYNNPSIVCDHCSKAFNPGNFKLHQRSIRVVCV